MRKRTMLTTAVCCVLGLSLVACVPQGEQQEGAVSQASPQITAEGMSMTEQVEALKQRNEEYVPDVFTMPDGVQVQRIPDSATSVHVAGVTGYDHNAYILNGNNRGCLSCHEDGLYDLVNNKMIGHMKLQTPLVGDLTINNCIACHSHYEFDDAAIMHGIHSRESFTGTCDSCHVTVGGETKMWDEAKFEVLDGITPVDASTVQPEFTYDQTTKTGPMNVDWMYDEFEIEMYDKTTRGEALDPAVFEDWELSFTGAVDKPSSIKLTDLIAKAEADGAVKEFDMTLGCVDGWPNSGLIANNTYKGIDFNYIMELAGVTDDAIAVTPITPIGNDFSNTTGFDQLDECVGTYMVYEMDGEPLSWDQGYPIRFMSSEYGAGGTMKWVSELRFETMDSIRNSESALYLVSNLPELADLAITTDNIKSFVGFANIYDGQIIKAGEPFEIQGYAFNANRPVASIEVSLDQGLTWTKLETPDCKPGVWAYWHFTMPFEPGAYTVSVRATFSDGEVVDCPTSKLINAK